MLFLLLNRNKNVVCILKWLCFLSLSLAITHRLHCNCVCTETVSVCEFVWFSSLMLPLWFGPFFKSWPTRKFTHGKKVRNEYEMKKEIQCEQKKYNNNTLEMIMWVNSFSYVPFIDSSSLLPLTVHALTHLHIYYSFWKSQNDCWRDNNVKYLFIIVILFVFFKMNCGQWLWLWQEACQLTRQITVDSLTRKKWIS